MDLQRSISAYQAGEQSNRNQFAVPAIIPPVRRRSAAGADWMTSSSSNKQVTEQRLRQLKQIEMDFSRLKDKATADIVDSVVEVVCFERLFSFESVTHVYSLYYRRLKMSR